MKLVLNSKHFSKKINHSKSKPHRKYLSSHHLERNITSRISLLQDELLKETILGKENYQVDSYIRSRQWQQFAIFNVDYYKEKDILKVLPKFKEFDIRRGTRKKWIKYQTYKKYPVLIICEGVGSESFLKFHPDLDNVPW